jgi:hypothetical protein
MTHERRVLEVTYLRLIKSHQGKGYYDKMLTSWNTQIATKHNMWDQIVGLEHSFQMWTWYQTDGHISQD